MSSRCPSCNYSLEAYLELTHDASSSSKHGGQLDFCPECGTELVPQTVDLISLAPGDVLPGSFSIQALLGNQDGIFLYQGRSRDNQRVRIKETLNGSEVAQRLMNQFELGQSPLLPQVLAYFSYGKRVYLVEQLLTWERPYFRSLHGAFELVQSLKPLLTELSAIHARKWSLYQLLRQGIFAIDLEDGSSRPITGSGGAVQHLGEPLMAMPEYLTSARFIPAVTEPCLDLLSVIEKIWPDLECDDSWQEVWAKAVEIPNKTKRRDFFFHTLAFSPRVIEWPPLGEVFSDLLSDPGVWSAADLLDRISSNPPARSVEVEVISHRGLKRSNNEDSALANQYELWFEGIPAKVWLLAVADGMGGAGAGEAASQLAIECLDNEIHSFVLKGGMSLSEQELKNAIAIANTKVHEARKNPNFARNMGTTVVAALVMGTRFCVAWVGDSRAYRVSASGECFMLTSDHTMVAQLVAAGSISEQDAMNHPMASRLTRAIGTEEHVVVDHIDGELKPGESLLLVSDGFVPALFNYKIPVDATPREALEALTVRMLKTGGQDNATAVLLRVQS